jgi:catalase
MATKSGKSSPATTSTAAKPMVGARDQKDDSPEAFRNHAENQTLTANQGLRITENQNSLRAGPRVPTLLEDAAPRAAEPPLTDA